MTNISFNVIIPHRLDRALPELHRYSFPVSVVAIVANVDEYKKLADRLEGLPVYKDASVKPVYDGNNTDFFEEHVFLGQTDLENFNLSKREIFMRQAINTFNFGKLTVLPDGTVYANVNMPPLGSINDTVYSLVYKELTEGKSWLHTRSHTPCTDCLFQNLCPSPSNYETVMGKTVICRNCPVAQ